jgi:hypothetical protein
MDQDFDLFGIRMYEFTVTLCPARLREIAAARPAMPAPTTMMSNSIFAIGNLLKKEEEE